MFRPPGISGLLAAPLACRKWVFTGIQLLVSVSAGPDLQGFAGAQLHSQSSAEETAMAAARTCSDQQDDAAEICPGKGETWGAAAKVQGALSKDGPGSRRSRN